MQLSLRLRRDFTVTDADRLLSTARRTYRELNPGASVDEANEMHSLRPVPNTTLRATCRWLLRIQIALTVVAAGVAGAAMASGPSNAQTASGSTVIVGVAVASPLLISCVLLLAGGGLGLVAMRRESRTWRLRAAVVLVAPAALAIGSLGSLPSQAQAIPDVVPDDVVRSLERMLTVLTWAHRLAFLAVVLAAAAGVLLLLSGRSAANSPAPPPPAP